VLWWHKAVIQINRCGVVWRDEGCEQRYTNKQNEEGTADYSERLLSNGFRE